MKIPTCMAILLCIFLKPFCLISLIFYPCFQKLIQKFNFQIILTLQHFFFILPYPSLGRKNLILKRLLLPFSSRHASFLILFYFNKFASIFSLASIFHKFSCFFFLINFLFSQFLSKHKQIL